MHPIGPYLESKTVGKRMRVGIRLSWCVCLVLVLLRPGVGRIRPEATIWRAEKPPNSQIYTAGQWNFAVQAASTPQSPNCPAATATSKRPRTGLGKSCNSQNSLSSGFARVERATSRDQRVCSHYSYPTAELITGRYSMPDNLAMATVSNAVQDGRNAICYRKAGPTPKYAACFDVSSGVLMSWDWQSQGDEHRFEYSNFVNDGGKMVARTMRRLKNGKLLMEVEINSVSDGSPADWIFDAPSNAIKQEECKKFEQATRFYTPSFFSLLPIINRSGMAL